MPASLGTTRAPSLRGPLRRLGARLWWSARPRRARWGDRLSAFGARHRIGWLEYNPLVFMWFHEHAVWDAPTVVRSFEQLFPDARSYYDAGAGTGAFAAEARRRGHPVLASEYSRVGRWAARVQRVRSVRLDLTDDPPAPLPDGGFGLAYSFEVAEHVPPEFGERLVAHLTVAAPWVVFTAAHPGQGGTGHVNEQEQGYWIERFARHGMRYREDLSARIGELWRSAPLRSDWLPDNVMVFARDDAP